MVILALSPGFPQVFGEIPKLNVGKMVRGCQGQIWQKGVFLGYFWPIFAIIL
nr:MAG TPA: hypothetical protein [Caudoviricetes sp.]